MIRNAVLWERFEAEWQRSQKTDLETHLRLIERLIEHARALGAWPPQNPLEGIETDIRLAKAVNTMSRGP